MVTACKAIFSRVGCTVSPIGVEAVGGSVQGADQASSRALSRAVAGDGGQAVVYLTPLVLDGLDFIPGFDTGQSCGLGFEVGADVLPPP
jgi:hypothetical protein